MECDRGVFHLVVVYVVADAMVCTTGMCRFVLI